MHKTYYITIFYFLINSEFLLQYYWSAWKCFIICAWITICISCTYLTAKFFMNALIFVLRVRIFTEEFLLLDLNINIIKGIIFRFVFNFLHFINLKIILCLRKIQFTAEIHLMNMNNKFAIRLNLIWGLLCNFIKNATNRKFRRLCSW